MASETLDDAYEEIVAGRSEVVAAAGDFVSLSAPAVVVGAAAAAESEDDEDAYQEELVPITEDGDGDEGGGDTAPDAPPSPEPPRRHGGAARARAGGARSCSAPATRSAARRRRGGGRSSIVGGVRRASGDSMRRSSAGGGRSSLVGSHGGGGGGLLGRRTSKPLRAAGFSQIDRRGSGGLGLRRGSDAAARGAQRRGSGVGRSLGEAVDGIESVAAKPLRRSFHGGATPLPGWANRRMSVTAAEKAESGEAPATRAALVAKVADELSKLEAQVEKNALRGRMSRQQSQAFISQLDSAKKAMESKVKASTRRRPDDSESDANESDSDDGAAGDAAPTIEAAVAVEAREASAPEPAAVAEETKSGESFVALTKDNVRGSLKDLSKLLGGAGERDGAVQIQTALVKLMEELKVGLGDEGDPTGALEETSKAMKALLQSAATESLEAMPPRRWWILDADGLVRKTLDVAVFGAAVAVAIWVPYSAAFLRTSDGGDRAFDALVTALFLADTAANCATAVVVDESGDARETRPAAIARRYFLRSTGVVDVLSSVPWHYVACGAHLSGDRRWVTCGRPLRLLRLFRVHQISKLRHFCEYLEMVFQWHTAWTTLMSFTLRMCLFSHFVGCAWYAIGTVALAHPDARWNAYRDDDGAGPGDRAAVATWVDVYRLFAILIMIVGVSYYTYIISSLSSIISTFDSQAAQVNEKLVAVRGFVRENKLPGPLADKVTTFFQAYYAASNWRMNLYDASELLANLPVALRCEIIMYIERDTISRIRFLDNKTTPFIADIVMMLQPAYYRPGDFVVKEHSPANEMFFLTRGKATVLQKGKSVFVADELQEKAKAHLTVKKRKFAVASPSVTARDLQALGQSLATSDAERTTNARAERKVDEEMKRIERGFSAISSRHAGAAAPDAGRASVQEGEAAVSAELRSFKDSLSEVISATVQQELRRGSARHSLRNSIMRDELDDSDSDLDSPAARVADAPAAPS
ncbi:voltage-gated potassium channel [Aureococcus anophagefferens]|nr:voltage-gated potassium channel [Aureococcus anophagefferens]